MSAEKKLTVPSTCARECAPHLYCVRPIGHAGMCFAGTIDIDAVHRKKPRLPRQEPKR